MRVAAQIDIAASADDVWAHVTDPTRTLRFWSGITRWECVSDETTGLGARYQMLMRVGSAEIGSLIEVVEVSPARDMATPRCRRRSSTAPGGGVGTASGSGTGAAPRGAIRRAATSAMRAQARCLNVTSRRGVAGDWPTCVAGFPSGTT